MSIDVSIVIVSYNVADLLDACLRSIAEGTVCSHEVIVVDNNSADHSVDMVCTKHPEVILIENKINFGFASANNQGFGRAKGRYIFMLNPDTLILENAINKLIQFMDSHPEAGACGPKVLNSDGSLQYSCHHFPTLGMHVCNHLRLSKKYPRNRIFGKFNMTYWGYDETMSIDWLTGCSIMLRRTALDQTSFLDPHYFMYFEETDLCLQLKKKQWQRIYYPEARIVHHGGKSSERKSKTDEISDSRRYLLSSRYYFIRKNYGAVQFYMHKISDMVFYALPLLKSVFRRNRPHSRKNFRYCYSRFSFLISLRSSTDFSNTRVS